MKENATDEILTAVRQVLAGDIYFSQRIGATFIRRSLEEKPAVSRIGVERLSDRELQVFQLIAASFSTTRHRRAIPPQRENGRNPPRKHQIEAGVGKRGRAQ